MHNEFIELIPGKYEGLRQRLLYEKTSLYLQVIQVKTLQNLIKANFQLTTF